MGSHSGGLISPLLLLRVSAFHHPHLLGHRCARSVCTSLPLKTSGILCRKHISIRRTAPPARGRGLEKRLLVSHDIQQGGWRRRQRWSTAGNPFCWVTQNCLSGFMILDGREILTRAGRPLTGFPLLFLRPAELSRAGRS